MYMTPSLSGFPVPERCGELLLENTVFFFFSFDGGEGGLNDSSVSTL